MTTIGTYIPQISLDLPQQKKGGSDQVYFQGSKKNQLNDMKKYFKSILSDPEKEDKRKEIIKKIISYTTLGIDTSRMFPEMVLASATKDLVQKKLIYFYLTIYSNSNENFARMTINTFMKDASSPNPNIRALSIRQLSNLRFKGRQEYVLPILKQGLMDFSPIVKKSSIMGLTKIMTQKNRKLQEPQRDQDMLNSLYQLIRDPDSSVVCTVLQSINQIQPEGIAMSKKLAQYLLQNLNNFNDYQLPTILKYFQLYQHKTEQEALSTMNTLYPKINSSNLAVTLEISKIYLKFGQIYPQHLENILQRLKKPLLSFLHNETNEIQFVALKHIEYIIQTYKTDIFKKDIKQFFLLSNQRTYVKAVKIKIMELNTDESNFSDMINQFAEYISDEEISKEAILTMERIMMSSSENDSKFIIKTIIKIIQSTHNDFLCNNALPTFRNFLRKYPKEFQLFQNIFYYMMGRITENQAKCAMIQIIGDFGQHIEEAVQLLAWSQNQVSDTLKICLLRANVKLFFKRPVQMMNMLTNIFNSILNNDETHLYVRDYASYLYRGLQTDIENFKKTFLETRVKVQMIPTQEIKLQINSLQVLYGQKEYKWLIQKDKYLVNVQEVDYLQAEIQDENQNQQMEEQELIKKNSINVDSKFKALSADDFDPQFQIDPDHFQNLWENLQVGSSITRMIKNIDLITQENLEQVFKIWNIGVMATADDEDSIKLYLYCKLNFTQSSQISIMQFQVLKLPQTMTMIIKSQNEQISGFISKYIQEFLKLNQII